MRTLIGLLILGTTGAALADPLTTDDQARIKRAGFGPATLVYDSATLRVASTKKAGRPRLVIVTPTKIVDAGKQDSGTLTITKQDNVGISPLTVLTLSYNTPMANDGYRARGPLWVVRADGALACNVPGPSSDSLGTKCGSSGYTSATASLKPDPKGGTFLDVKYLNSGNYSTPDGKGGCLARSPVRGGHSARWHIRDVGVCKPTVLPVSRDVDPMDP